MRAGTYNFTCEQGSTFTRLIELEEPNLADPTGGTFSPVDITGYTARMQIRRTLESTSPMISLTTENNRLVVNPVVNEATNQILITLSDAETSTLTTNGVYDLEIESPEGVVSRILQGAVTVSLEVTR